MKNILFIVFLFFSYSPVSHALASDDTKTWQEELSENFEDTQPAKKDADEENKDLPLTLER